MTLGESLNLSATACVNKLKIIPATSRKERRLMVARLSDNCLCGSFSHSLFCVYVYFFQCLIFFRIQIQPPHILTQRQSYFQMQDDNTCTQNYISLHTVSTHKGPPFPLCGRKRKAKEKSIWKRILAYMLFSSPHLGVLVASYSPASSSLNPTLSRPYILSPFVPLAHVIDDPVWSCSSRFIYSF